MGMEALTFFCPLDGKILFFTFFFDFRRYFCAIFDSQILLYRFAKFFMDMLIHVVVTL